MDTDVTSTSFLWHRLQSQRWIGPSLALVAALMVTYVCLNRGVLTGTTGVALLAFAASTAFLSALVQLARRNYSGHWASEPQLRLLTDSLPVLISLIDQEERYVFANAAYERWIGRKHSELIGRTVLEILGPDFYKSIEGYLRRAQLGETVTYELVIEMGDLGARNVDVTYIPYVKPDGTIAGTAAVVSDVTDHKSAAVQLAAARDAAEAANRAKSTFLANMSHEIRTPLGVILGFSEMLGRSAMSEAERQNALDAIERNGRQLVTLIDDILDLSKVEAGHMTVERRPLSLREFLAETESDFRSAASARGLTFRLELEDKLPSVIFTDPVRLKQILSNIIGNSIKFTATGGVTVRCTEQRTRSRSLIRFEVQDTGIGVAADQAENIFKAFSQADASMTRRFGGTGLGLALSRRLARLLGGDVVLVESQPGKGSTFSVTVEGGHNDEFAETAGAFLEEGNTPPARDLEGVRILVVDDMEDNRELLRLFLQRAGAVVVAGEDGRAALKSSADDDVDVILMDLRMPVMDGYEALRRLRAAGFRRPVIAVTAHALQDEREKCLTAGFDDYLSKPFNSAELIARIKKNIASDRT